MNSGHNKQTNDKSKNCQNEIQSAYIAFHFHANILLKIKRPNGSLEARKILLFADLSIKTVLIPIIMNKMSVLWIWLIFLGQTSQMCPGFTSDGMGTSTSYNKEWDFESMKKNEWKLLLIHLCTEGGAICSFSSKFPYMLQHIVASLKIEGTLARGKNSSLFSARLQSQTSLCLTS